MKTLQTLASATEQGQRWLVKKQALMCLRLEYNKITKANAHKYFSKDEIKYGFHRRFFHRMRMFKGKRKSDPAWLWDKCFEGFRSGAKAHYRRKEKAWACKYVWPYLTEYPCSSHALTERKVTRDCVMDKARLQNKINPTTKYGVCYDDSSDTVHGRIAANMKYNCSFTCEGKAMDRLGRGTAADKAWHAEMAKKKLALVYQAFGQALAGM